MPYTPATVPDYVPKAKAAQWANVWNSTYKRCMAGKTRVTNPTDKKCETFAFQNANGVIKKESIDRAIELGREAGWEVRIIGAE